MDFYPYEEEEINDYIVKSVSERKDELLKEQNEEIDYLSYRLDNLRRLAENVKMKEDQNIHGIQDKINDIINNINSLESAINDLKLQLRTDENLIANNSNKITELEIIMNEFSKIQHDLNELAKRIDEIEEENEKIQAYLTDKVTLHLDYSRESNGLYTFIPFTSSINQWINDMIITDDKKDSLRNGFNDCSKINRAFSFSQSTLSGKNKYILKDNNDKEIVTIIINNDDNDTVFYASFTMNGKSTETKMNKYNEYGDIVYTVLIEQIQVKKQPRDKSENLMVKMFSDSKLLDKAYKQEDTQYDESDIVMQMTGNLSVQNSYFLDERFVSEDSPVIVVVGKFFGVETTLDYALTHFSSKLTTQLLQNMQQVKVEEQRMELYEKQVTEGSVLANLMLDVNMLKANSVRAVTATVGLSQDCSISIKPILPSIECKTYDYINDGPMGDDYKWWQNSDPYLRQYARRYRNVFRVPQNTIDENQSVQFKITTVDINSTTESLAMGRIRCFTTLDESTLGHTFSENGFRSTHFLIHIPNGRDEIASSNDNSDIYNEISFEPNYFGQKSKLYYSAVNGAKTPFNLELKIYPGESLPLTSKVLESNDLTLIMEDKEYKVPTTWATRVERDGSEERLLLIATLDLRVIITDERKVCIPLAVHDFTTDGSNKSKSVVRKWATSDDIFTTTGITHTDGSTFYPGVNVSNPSGGHSLANTIYGKIVTTTALPSFPSNAYNVASMKKDGKLIMLSDSGWKVTGGHLVKIKAKTDLVKMRYLQDPIGVGSVSYVDYAINDIYMKLQSIQNQIVNINELIERIDKRLAFVEKSVLERQSFLAGALSSLAMVSTYINPLIGITLSLIAEAYTIFEMTQKGINADNMTYVLTNLLDILIAIKNVRAKPPNWISQNGKYDVAKATAESQKQVARVKLEKYTQHGDEFLDTGVLNTHNVQIMHRPIEDFKYGTYFEKVLGRMSAGIASKQDKLIFAAANKMKVNPTHQFLRTSAVRRGTDNKLIKDVWIFGIGDGYSQMVNRSWLGWKNTALIPRKTQGELSPGAFKMSFVKTDEKWEIAPWRSSGMTQTEILEASGMTKSSAKLFLDKASQDEVNLEIGYAYDRLVSHYMYNSKSVVVNESKIQLMDGQMDVLYDSIKKSSYDAYTYSLVGNNCQHFVDSTMKMLEQPSYKPVWMSTSQYANYIATLDNNFAKYTN